MADVNKFVFVLLILLLFQINMVTSYGCYRGCLCSRDTVTCYLSVKENIPIFYTKDYMTSLTVYGSGKLRQIPDHLFTVSDFQNVEFVNTRLQDLPCSVFDGLEKHTRSLKFVRHEFETIPQCTINDLDILRVVSYSHGLLQKLINGDFGGKPEMRVLDLSYNQIQDIDVRAIKGMPNLDRLILKGNKLVTLKPQQFKEIGTPAVQLLDLSYNMIEVISPDVFDGFGTNLHGLDLSFNRITQTTWPQIILAFPTFPGLRLLNVSGNSLVSVDAQTFLNYFSDLYTLGISDCALTALNLKEFSSFGNLDVSKNNGNDQEMTISSENYTCETKEKGDFNCSEIRLNVSRNSLKTIHIVRRFGSDNKKLVVAAEKNQLTRVEVTLLNTSPLNDAIIHPDVEFFLGHNRLETGVLLNLSQVNPIFDSKNHFSMSLYLNDNQLANGLNEPLVIYRQFRDSSASDLIPFCNISSKNIEIEVLDLSGNGIMFLPNDLCFIQNVIILKLNRNSIQNLDFSQSFKYQSTIKVIEARENKLTSLSNNAFKDLHNLERIDLRDNKLTSLPDMTYLNSISNIELLQLDGNPLICDCVLAKLATVKALYPDSSLELKITGQCVGPEEFDSFNPLCFSLGTVTCPSVNISNNDQKRLGLACDEDNFSDIKDFSVTVDNEVNVVIAWHKFGPGRVDGYLISVNNTGRDVIFVPFPATNTTIGNLPAGETVTLCIELLMTTTAYQEPGEPRFCQTVTLGNVISPTVLGLGISLGVVLLFDVLTIVLCVLRLLRKDKSKGNEYESAGENNDDYRVGDEVLQSTSRKSSYVLPTTSRHNTARESNGGEASEEDYAEAR